MTEAEWLACEEREKILSFLQHHPSAPHVPGFERKLRLFVCACCRLVWDVFPHDACRHAVVIAEAYADGAVRGEAVAKAHAVINNLPVPPGSGWREVGGPLGLGTLPTGPAWAAQMAAHYVTYLHGPRYPAGETLGTASAALHGPAQVIEAADAHGAGAGAETARLVVHLFRDVIGNPFRPVAFSPTWRTGTAVALATQMYESRDFGAMPILADALEEAGCDSEDVLTHCRGGDSHIRGCWVVDLILGKE